MELGKKLLILTCDLNPSKEKKQKVKKIASQNINWVLFLKLIYKNGTYPLVHHNFKEILPKEHEKESIIKSVGVKIYNDMLLKELVHISELFKKNDIPFIVLKGLPLAQDLYGSIYLRPIKDLDLLVKREHLEKVESLLRERGYSYPTNSEKSWRLDSHMHLNFYNKKKIPIEIHWTIRPERWNIKIPETDYWQEIKKIRINNKCFYVLDTEYLFIYSCLHIISHIGYMGVGLKYLYDLALVLDKYNLNWHKISYLSKQYKISTFVYSIISKVRGIFDVKVSEENLMRLKKDSSIEGLSILKKTDLNFRLEKEYFETLIPMKK